MSKLLRKTQQPSEFADNQIHDAYSTSTTDTYSCNYINNKLIYSKNEQVIGTWLGKPLYRKVYSILAINTGLDQIFDVSALNISEISKIEGIVTYQTKYQTSLIKKTVTYYDSQTKKITVYIPPGEDAINNGKLVIEYTKTTD